jgi:hypothetical protein
MNIPTGAGAAPKMAGVSNLIFSMPSALYFGMSAVKGVGKIFRDGTTLTNPMYFRNVHSGYGKRGLDGDNLGADGLVQGLHNKRRK